MRTLEFTDKKVIKALEEKGKLINRGREISRKIEDLQTELNKLGLKVQKIKDDTVLPFVREIIAGLGKYEDLETLNLVNGKLVVNVFDVIEEYKAKIDSVVGKDGELRNGSSIAELLVTQEETNK